MEFYLFLCRSMGGRMKDEEKMKNIYKKHELKIEITRALLGIVTGWFMVLRDLK